jgi:hypothetical protein
VCCSGNRLAVTWRHVTHKRVKKTSTSSLATMNQNSPLSTAPGIILQTEDGFCFSGSHNREPGNDELLSIPR